MSKPNLKTIYATLVRGRSYRLRDKLFENGKPVEITRDERAHLEEHAIDLRTYPPRTDREEPEVRALPKFEFSEVLP